MARGYEGSKADTKVDRSAAKKDGMSLKKYEASAADKKADKAASGKKK